MLTKNQLKILAIVCMTIDHIGVAFFPNEPLLRMIGRLAFPIFSYGIAEGCRYTRNKRRYFGGVFLCGAVCALALLPVGGFYGNALITMSMSILLVYALQKWENSGEVRCLALTFALAAVFYVLCRTVYIDYGFAGVLLPMYAELGRLLAIRFGLPEKTGERAGFAVGLLALSAVMGGLQPWCLLSLIPICLFGSQRGRWKMKHFFYVYYPAHLALIGALRTALEAAAG